MGEKFSYFKPEKILPLPSLQREGTFGSDVRRAITAIRVNEVYAPERRNSVSTEVRKEWEILLDSLRINLGHELDRALTEELSQPVGPVLEQAKVIVNGIEPLNKSVLPKSGSIRLVRTRKTSNIS